jgi:hypothetical protein
MAITGVSLCVIGLALSIVNSVIGAYLSVTSGSNSMDGSGLPKELMPIATVTLIGAWEEEDMAVNDKNQWSGTAFVTERGDGTLILYTNKHCLDLDSLGKADVDGSPEVLSYSLWVHFPTGVDRWVLRMAPESSNLDLARLEVDAQGLIEGKDYVVADGDVMHFRFAT